MENSHYTLHYTLFLFEGEFEVEMGNPNPNMGELGKATRFPSNRQNHTKKGPYLVPLIRKFLEKKIDFEDPETRKMINGRVKDAVIWRLLLNATQGENQAIKEILDRMDGKVTDFIIDQSKHTYLTKVEVKVSDDTKLPLTQKAGVDTPR